MFKSGFVAIIGRPNVGKSTLLNQIIGEKISIVSNKAQTTRNTIKLILNDKDSQIIFLDTPGFQNPKNKLGEFLLKESESSKTGADIITVLTDISDSIGKMDSKILEGLKDTKIQKVLLINKIDLLESKKDIDAIIAMYESTGIFNKILPISALNNEGLNEYVSFIKDNLKEGPMYYPDDYITDLPEKFIAQEIIREKALIHLDEEIPHGIMVEIESFKERSDKNIIDIEATIYAEKDSHKGMVIGKNGAMLKKIGTDARLDLESFLDTKVNLKLWVKVDKNWREKERSLKNFGYK